MEIRFLCGGFPECSLNVHCKAIFGSSFLTFENVGGDFGPPAPKKMDPKAARSPGPDRRLWEFLSHRPPPALKKQNAKSWFGDE